jgi:hypothetical protein
MTEIEGAYEDSRYGFTQFQYPDESRRSVTPEAMRMTRDAVAFVVDIVSRSRTGKSALMKLAVVNSLFGNLGESSADIAKRFNVSVRAVENCKAELRKDFLVRGKV